MGDWMSQVRFLAWISPGYYPDRGEKKPNTPAFPDWDGGKTKEYISIAAAPRFPDIRVEVPRGTLQKIKDIVDACEKVKKEREARRKKGK